MSFTDPTIVSMADDPTGATATAVKAVHITELQTAINAVRSLASLSSATWTYSVSSGSTIHVEDVRDLRTALDAALSTLNIQTSSYTDNTLVGYSENPLTATTIKAIHIRELRSRVTSNVGTTGSGGSGAGLVYVLSDLQGSTRAVMNNAGSSSAIVARHDYLPFGEEIGSGIGPRTLAQGYNASDNNRWKYAMTERDATSGLDHTWFRKYENLSGRWTSPDPYDGSLAIANPQSLNRFAYVGNDPTNSFDPSGLYGACIHEAMTKFLAQLAGYSSAIASTLGALAGDKPHGADSKENSIDPRDNLGNYLEWLEFDMGPGADIHFASEEKLAEYKASFQSDIRSKNYKHAAFGLHAIEDVHGAHKGFGWPTGHASDPGVDWIIGDAKFRNVANEVFGVLSGNSGAQLSDSQFSNLIDAIVRGCEKGSVHIVGNPRNARGAMTGEGPTGGMHGGPKFYDGSDAFDGFRYDDLWYEREKLMLR